MSNKVDQRIVEMRFENSQFEKGVSQSISSLDKLKQSLNFDKSISKSSFDSVASNISGLSSSVDTIAERFTNLGVIGVGALMNIGATAVDVGKTMVQNLMTNITAGYDRYNEMMESQQTIMYATRGDWDDTNAQMDYINAQIEKLNWYTDETSYNLTDMTSSIGKFVSAGVPLDDAVVDMMGIASWAAISGQNAQKASYAMYNLSQAMAMGKLTNLDWKSIENANMATREFKNVAIQCGVALGTLWEGADGLIYGFDQYGHEIEVNADNFRTTLSGGWLDRDVLSATLREYGDFANELNRYVEEYGVSTNDMLEIVQSAYDNGIQNLTKEEVLAGKGRNWLASTLKELGIDNAQLIADGVDSIIDPTLELGFAAFKAGQECKTLNDALDYTKDAVTTGWMNIFEKIFGDYLESKDLWTEVAEVLYEQLVRPVEKLGEIFDNAYDLGAFTYLKDGLFNLYDTFNQVTSAIKEGWAEVFRSFTGLDLTIFLIKFRNFSRTFKLIDLPYYSDIENIKNSAISLANALNVFVTNLKKIGQSVKDAWERIFPKKVPTTWTTDMKSFTDKVLEFAQSVEKLAEKFKLTDSQAKKLERTFAGVFAIFDMIRMAVVAFIKPLGKVDAEVGSFADTILDATASWGDWVVAWHDWMEETGFFDQVAAKVYEWFNNIPIWADKATMALFGMHLNEFFKTIGDDLGLAAGAILLFFIDLPSNAQKAFEFITGETDFLTWWDKLKEKVKGAWDNIQDFFNNLPQKMDDLSQALFGTDWATVWAEIQTGVYNAYQDIAKFFGFIEEYDERGFKKNSPFQQILMDIEDTWDELVAKFEELKGKLEPVGDWLVENVFSEEGMEEGKKVLKYAGVIGSIAAVLFLLWQVANKALAIVNLVKDMKGIKTGDKGGLLGKLFEMFGPLSWMKNFMEEASDAMGNVKKLLKGGYFALMGLLVLELATSLLIVSYCLEHNPGATIGAFILLLIAFAGIFVAAVKLISPYRAEDIEAVGKSMALMGFVFFEIAASLFILQNIPFPQLMGSVLALGILFVVLAVAFAVLMKINPESAAGGLYEMSISMAIMAGSVVILAFALLLLKDLSFEQMCISLFAVIALLATLFVFALLVTKTGANAGLYGLAFAFLAIGAAVLLMSAGMLLASYAIDVAADGISKIVDAIIKMGDAVDAPQQLGEALVQFFVGVANAIAENREPLTEGITNLWGIFIDAFNTIMPQVMDAIQNFITRFLDMLTTVWPQIETFLLMAQATALAILRQLLMGVMQILNELLPLVLEHVSILINGIIDLLVNVTPRLTAALFSLLMDTLNQILANIGEIVALSVQIGIEIVLGLLDGLAREFPNIVDKGIEFVLAFINGIADGIEKHAEDIRNTIENLKTSLLNAATTILGLDKAENSEFGNVGGSMISNLISGILGKAADAYNAIKNVITGAIDAAKNALDSNSPSKVFTNIGNDVDRGFINGISDPKLVKQVNDATKSMANSSIESMGNTFKQVAGRVKNIINDFQPPTITPVLDTSEIESGFSDIGNMFTDSSMAIGMATLNDSFMNNNVAKHNDFVTGLADGTLGNSFNKADSLNQTITFNIDGAKDPKAVADEVSSILQNQIDRRNAVWA